MQKIFAENQKFAPTYFQFNYQASNVYKGSIVKYPDTCLDVAKNYGTLTKVKSVSVDKEHVLINEFFDGEKGNYMYAVLNMVSMTAGGVPRIFTPLRSRSAARFNGVWPPN